MLPSLPLTSPQPHLLSPSPSPPVTFIIFTVVIAGDIASFDEAAYRTGLAAQLNGVSPDEITLAVDASSVRVATTISVANATVADISLGILTSLAASPATLSSALGVSIEAIEIVPIFGLDIDRTQLEPSSMPSPPSHTPDCPPSEGDPLQTSAVNLSTAGSANSVGIVVAAVAAGLLAVCGVAMVCERRKAQRRKEAQSTVQTWLNDTVKSTPSGGTAKSTYPSLASDVVKQRDEELASAETKAAEKARAIEMGELELAIGLASAVSSAAPASSSGSKSSARISGGIMVWSAADCALTTETFADHKVLGHGGFGTVYLGEVSPNTLPWWHGTSIACAVKKLDSASSQGQRELYNEIQVLGKCKHESLLSLLAYCPDPKCSCLIYPLMCGGNLDHRLLLTNEAIAELAKLRSEPHEPLSWRERARIMRDATRALVFLHSSGDGDVAFLHRDIKTSNILLDAHNNAKLADVGLAKAAQIKAGTLAGGQSTTLVNSTRVLGTPGFLDAQVLVDGKYSRSTDGYAMAVVMLICLTGKEVIQARDAGEQMAEVPEDIPSLVDPAADWPTEVSLRLGKMIRQLMHPHRRQRIDLPDALKELEDICESSSLRPGVIVADATKECIICMAEPREVRFACGHCVCCAVCTDLLLGRLANCPVCATKLVVVERSARLGSAATFVASSA